MTNMNIEEGSINVKSEVVKVMSIVKEIIRGLYNKSYVKGGLIGAGKVVKEDEFSNVLRYINYELKHRLKDSGVIGCPILFVTWLRDGKTYGGYHPELKIIVLDAYKYLVRFDDKTKVDVYKNFSKILFDDMRRTIEHELIHQQQDVRSGGKFFNSNKGKISDDEVKDILKKKYYVAPDMSDDEFIETIKYYNDVSELDTFANNVADEYIQYKMKKVRDDILKDIKSGNIEPTNYSAEEVRKMVLGGILKNKYNGYSIGLEIQRKLIELSDGYELLTVDNKKRYWKYLFKALLVNRFEPMIFVK